MILSRGVYWVFTPNLDEAVPLSATRGPGGWEFYFTKPHVYVCICVCMRAWGHGCVCVNIKVIDVLGSYWSRTGWIYRREL